jgi:hypothetical protein
MIRFLVAATHGSMGVPPVIFIQARAGRPCHRPAHANPRNQEGLHVNQLYPLEGRGHSITDAIDFWRVRMPVESANQMVEYWFGVF